jgi:hypothetical protein
MKKMIFLVALMIPLMAGTMFADYQSSTQKKEAVHAQVKMVALNSAQKSEFELKIKANEIRITELNLKIKKPAELFDTLYVKKIANLEKENRYLKARLEAY